MNPAHRSDSVGELAPWADASALRTSVVAPIYGALCVPGAELSPLPT